LVNAPAVKTKNVLREARYTRSLILTNLQPRVLIEIRKGELMKYKSI